MSYSTGETIEAKVLAFQLDCPACEALRVQPTGYFDEKAHFVKLPVTKLPCEVCVPIRADYLRRVYRFDEMTSAVARLNTLIDADRQTVVIPLTRMDKKRGLIARKGCEYAYESARRRNFGQSAVAVMNERLSMRDRLEQDPWVHIRHESAGGVWLREPISPYLIKARQSIGVALQDTGYAFVRELDKIIAEFQAYGY
jgi:hypothetical protein